MTLLAVFLAIFLHVFMLYGCGPRSQEPAEVIITIDDTKRHGQNFPSIGLDGEAFEVVQGGVNIVQVRSKLMQRDGVREYQIIATKMDTGHELLSVAVSRPHMAELRVGVSAIADSDLVIIPASNALMDGRVKLTGAESYERRVRKGVAEFVIVYDQE